MAIKTTHPKTERALSQQKIRSLGNPRTESDNSDADVPFTPEPWVRPSHTCTTLCFEIPDLLILIHVHLVQVSAVFRVCIGSRT